MGTRLDLQRNHSLGAFSQTIRGRAFVFIGDSTMGMQYHAFCTSLGAEVVDVLPDGTEVSEMLATSSPSAAPRQRGFKRETDDDEGNEQWDSHPGQAGPQAAGGGGGIHKACHLPHHDSTAIFLGFGHLFQWQHTLSADHLSLISRTLASLSSADVVLFSVGVHWHYFCDQPLQASEIASFKNFEYALRTLISLLPASPQADGPGRRSQSSTSSWKHARLARTVPTILYREALPQHFSTSNGQFPSPFRHRSHHGSLLTCSEATAASFAGLGRSSSYHNRAPVAVNTTATAKSKKTFRDVVKSKTSRFVPPPPSPSSACDPNCLPPTWQNDLAASVLGAQRSDVDILRVFRSLECLPHEHSRKNKHDCTHFTTRVNSLLNILFLRRLRAGEAKHRRRHQ